jgi:uncharacterized membrane protein
MIGYFKLYLVSLTAFLAIDMVWLSLLARSFYRQYLGVFMAPSPNWAVAISFYLLFIIGLLVFVIIPGLKANSLPATILKAAFFGLVTYATYDLTNLATLKDWPVLVSIVDIVWGMFLNISVSIIGYIIGKRLV